MRNFWQAVRSGFDSIYEGFDSIARATASFNIFPEPMEDTFERLDLPKSNEEAFERDRKALESDWKKVLGE